ncbi:MAG: DUF4401 domain-containing protein [Myxococcota bacterium]
MTWRELLARLPGTDADAAAAALRDPKVVPPPTPLLVRVLTAMGAWIASCFLLGSVGTCAGLILEIDEPEAFGLIGLALIVGALLVRRLVPGPFVNQLALSFGAAGQFMFGGALVQVASERTIALVWLVLSAALVALHADRVQRFVSTLMALSALAWLMHRTGWTGAPDAFAVLLTAIVIGLAALPRSIRFDDAPVFAGALIMLLFGLLALRAVLWLHTFGVPDVDAPRIVAAPWGIAGALVVASWLALRAQGARLFSELGVVAVGGAAALGAVAHDQPGILAALLGMILGFARHRAVVGVATAFLVLFGVWFYYDLSLTLWVKAGVLVGSGLTLLVVRAWLGWRGLLRVAA